MNSQANFSVGVDEMPTGFSCRLIRPDGAIFMEREFLSRHEAESHRDRLIDAWKGGLTQQPTRVLKLVEDTKPQEPECGPYLGDGRSGDFWTKRPSRGTDPAKIDEP